MKILHVASYNYLKNGQTYYATDYKIHNGLTRNGHTVYPFSYRDTARCSNIFGSKSWGAGKTNQRLIETCQNFKPDIVLLAHAELITLETLKAIRHYHPTIKIGMWFVDALFNQHNVDNIKSKLEALDALFVTTGGEWLKQFENGHTHVEYMPNLVDVSIDCHQAFTTSHHPVDFLFCGTDYKDPERQKFLTTLHDDLDFLKAKFFGCLGQPRIFGADYMDVLSRSRMGLNYSRRNDVELYSSDRIAHLTGNGLLTFTPRIPGFEELYSDDEVVYFDSYDELLEKIRYYHGHPDAGTAIARRGWEKAHYCYNNTLITKFMIETILRGV